MSKKLPAAFALLPLFHVCNAYYKAVNHQPIGVHVLIPRELPKGKRPLLVRIHGGAFSEGTSDSWLRPLIIELALKRKGILVSPDYRLKPEAQFTDIIDDMRDFWNSPSTPKQKPLTPGYVVQYLFLDLASHLEWLESTPEAPKIPASVHDEHITNSIPGHIITRVPNGSRFSVICSMMHDRRFADAQKHPHLDPIKNLETAGPLPPVFLFHGRDDTSVRVSDAETWADKLKILQPDVPLHLVLREGEPCFDQSDTLAKPWLRNPIEFVERYWPVKSYDMRSVLSC
ncbi:putative Alpha/Beta hydrolase protein [Seiridium cardinale]